MATVADSETTISTTETEEFPGDPGDLIDPEAQTFCATGEVVRYRLLHYFYLGNTCNYYLPWWPTKQPFMTVGPNKIFPILIYFFAIGALAYTYFVVNNFKLGPVWVFGAWSIDAAGIALMFTTMLKSPGIPPEIIN